MHGKACFILAILFLLVCAALQARDFREYGIREHVNSFPELMLDNASDSTRFVYISDQITHYEGIYSKDLVITADAFGDITSKSIVLEGKNPEYATQVFNIWNNRLKSFFGSPQAVILDTVILDDSRLADSALQEFSANGRSIEFIYHGKTVINTCGMKRYATGDEMVCDVSIIVTGK